MDGYLRLSGLLGTACKSALWSLCPWRFPNVVRTVRESGLEGCPTWSFDCGRQHG